jgi:small-conductance mechanosensitive channel
MDTDVENGVESLLSFGSSIFTDGLILFLVRCVVVYFFCRFLVKIIHRSIVRTTSRLQADKVNATSMGYLEQILRAILYIISVFYVLSAVKPLAGAGTALLGATSVLSVIVGLAAQETFGNFIAGLSLTTTQPIHVGDLVNLRELGITGTVQRITFRHTVILALDTSTAILVPNSKMNAAIIENYEDSSRPYEAWISVGVAYDTDLDKAIADIQDVVSHLTGFVDLRTEEEKAAGKEVLPVRVADFQDSSVLLKFPVYCSSLLTSKAVCSDARKGVLERFRQDGITIPFPIVTLDSSLNREKNR